MFGKPPMPAVLSIVQDAHQSILMKITPSTHPTVAIKEGIHWQALPEDVLQWVKENPGLATGIASCVVVPAAAVAATPLALSVAGFGLGGIGAASIAAGVQSGIGNVAAGSIFATLQSAGAGGAGAATVNLFVGGSTAAATVYWAMAIMALVVSARERHTEMKGGRGYIVTLPRPRGEIDFL